MLAELGGVRLLTDPLLRAGILHVRRQIPAPVVEDLRPLDAILISRAHNDHLDRRSLRGLAGDWPVSVPRGCGWILRRMGALDVIELEAGDRMPIGEVVAEAISRGS